MVNHNTGATDSSTGLAGTGLTRRKLLALLGGGTATGFVLGSRPWFRSAFASTEPPGPTIPPPSVPAMTPLQRGTPTVADLASSLDWDLDKMFRYVADEVRYDPYVGALRGATGTMWGKAGNAVDQALLLGALLGEAAIPWRFAIGELGDEPTSALLAAAAFDADTERKRLADVVLVPDVAAAWSGEQGWQRDPQADQVLAEARGRMDESIRVLEDALSAAGLLLPDVEVAVSDRERTQHVWIQYADGPNWIDLDPALPGVEPGTAMATVTDTQPDLPDDMFHTVTFRCSADVITGGQPARTEVLSHTVRSADLAGIPVMLMHPSAEWIGVAAAITGNQQYVPTLIVGEEIVEGTIITLSSGDGVLDAMGDEGTPEGQALAAWFDVEVAVPGESVKTFTRTIFDRLGAERRAAGTLDPAQLEPIELVEIDELGKVYLPLAGAITFTVAAQPTPWTYFSEDPTTLDDVGRLVQPAHAFQYLRDSLRLETLGELGTRFYDDEPNVVAWWTAAGQAGEASAQGASVAVDVIHAHHAEMASGGARRSGVVAAALDHAAERIVLEGTNALLTDPLEATLVSVGRVFELAAEAGIDVITLTSADGDVPAVGPFAAQLIQAALDAGKAVVIPERAVDIGGVERIGWWEVDVSNGHVVDRLDDGRGAELGEYMMMVHHMVSQITCLLLIGMTIGFVIAAAAGHVGAGDKAMTTAAIGAGQCALGFGGGGH